jgi:HK97 family phage prohead protease
MRGQIVGNLEVKAVDPAKRTFTGALSTSHLDLGGWFYKDIVYPGAFKRTLDHFKKSKDPYVPLLDSHGRGSVFNAFGLLEEGEEELTGKTLKYEMEDGTMYDVPEMLLMTTWSVIKGADGDRLLDRIESRVVRKMSMGYDSEREEFVTLKGHGKTRVLKEVKLGEGSVVIFPMNPNAEISKAKAILEMLDLKTLTQAERHELIALLKGEPPVEETPAKTSERAQEDPDRKALEALFQDLELRSPATA